MEYPSAHHSENPLEGLVSEDIYQRLVEHDLLSEKGVRDFRIREAFREMRHRDTPAYEAIEALREEHPYLQFDTIRKIVYRLRTKKR